MTTTVSQASSNNMADSLATDIGTSSKLKFYTAADALLATCTYSAAQGVVSTSTGREVLTFAHGNYTDETNATAGTVSYATIETSADVERVRFDDPVNDISLSSATLDTGDTVDVNADIVIRLPLSTA